MKKKGFNSDGFGIELPNRISVDVSRLVRPAPMFLRLFVTFIVVILLNSAFAFKEYSGIRAFNDTRLLVLQHRETIAVVELGNNRSIFTCELIEVLTNEEKQKALESLARVIRKKPVNLNFNQMMDLMRSCAKLPEPMIRRQTKSVITKHERTLAGWGIVPGTKWCGNRDVAQHYFDLGPEANVDACCRMHDICPAKVLNSDSKYGINNEGYFTILHCDCDTIFHDCLKERRNRIADSMGSIYFNLLRGNCMHMVNGKFVLTQKPLY